MANLTPVSGWDNVPQLETNTPALGGPGGAMNSQAQALLNRLEFLKSVSINVKNFGAKGDGVTDDAPAFQAAVNYAISSGVRRIFVPFGLRERYRLGSTVTIESSGFAIIGNATPLYNPDQNSGYLFGDAGVLSLFDYGNSRSDLASNQFVSDGVTFYSNTGKTQNAIKFTQNNNGPHRGFLVRNCAAKGFANVVLFDVPTSSNLSVASVDFQSCVLSGNTNSVNAVERAFGLRYVGNQSEAGARINGYFDSGVTITDNMLEGQSNPINIDSNSASVIIENNYFEAVSGDYIARIKGTNANAVVDIRPNYISNPTSSDIFRLEGILRIRETIDTTISSTRKSPITLNGLVTCPGTKMRGRFYVGSAAGSMGSGFCDPTQIGKFNPSGLLSMQNLGTVALDTPFGQQKTGVTIAGFPATYFRINGFSYSVGDVVVVCALVQTDSSGVPYLGIYNQSSASIGVSQSQISMLPYTKGWHLMYAVGVATQAGTQLAFRFGSDGTNTAATQILSVAAIGGYTIPAANFETFNGQNRYPIELFNPFDVTKPLEGSTTYDPPSLATGTSATTTVTVLQAVTGDYADASFSNDLQGITVSAWVSAANTVTIRFQNQTGATIDLASGTLRARVRKV